MDERTSRAANRIDFDAFRLVNVVDMLHRHGELIHHDEPIDLIDIAKPIESSAPAICFRNIRGCTMPLVGNILGTRKRLALALGIQERELITQLRKRLATRYPPTEVTSAEAPVHEVVLTGKQADLSRLPIHLQHTMDGAPYISASLDFTTEPDTGRINVGCRRMMPMSRTCCAVDMNSPSDFRAAYIKHVEQRKPFPVAFVIGSHPADHLGSQVLVPKCNELALIGSLREASVPVVRCKAIDQLVPADAEIVLEGHLDPAGYDQIEGPYGEYLGYYGKVKKNPLFRLSAITMRQDAMFETMTIGGYNIAATDTAQLTALRTELAVMTALESVVRETVAVYCPPGNGGMFNVRFSIRPRYAGEARNALAAVLSSPADVKHAFVVDDDIDVFSDAQIDWALATRFQVERDLMVLTGMRAYPLDPSLIGAARGSKAGFDLTIPFEHRGTPEYSVPTPPVFVEGPAQSSVEAILAQGPKSYYEIMMALQTRDGREILASFDELLHRKRLQRLADGRYQLTN